jgi:hypothetical protein
MVPRGPQHDVHNGFFEILDGVVIGLFKKGEEFFIYIRGTRLPIADCKVVLEPRSSERNALLLECSGRPPRLLLEYKRVPDLDLPWIERPFDEEKRDFGEWLAETTAEPERLSVLRRAWD